ncbi:MAG TPA: hypothetical protein VKB36_19380, partial [Vicinamibacterales bacterium]|nr:hypothetical protein [Vicinamibacterales bacterium]
MTGVTRVLVALALIVVSSLLAVAQTGRSPAVSSQPLAVSPAKRAFSVVEATIPEMQRAMREGRTTSRELVR